MNRNKLICLAVVLASFLVSPVFAAEPAFNGCPQSGTANGPHKDLNRLKNRWAEPAKYEAMTVKQIAALPDDETRRAQYEKKGVVAEGYIISGHAQGAESVNCGGSAGYDKHVWLSGSPRPHGDYRKTAALRPFKQQSIVVEPTPYWQEQRPIMKRDATYERLANQGAKVRVFGWLLYDPEHPDQIGQTRVSLWEIHPVTKIEVWSNNQWRELQ